MKNLFTNLMNWMMGSEMSKVVHEPAGSTTIAESPRNIPLITPLSPPNHPLLCRFRSIKTPLRFVRYVAMIFAVLVMSMANIGMAWGATETITWNGTSLTGSGGTNVTAGTATAVNGSTYKAGTISINSSTIATESKKHSSDSYWEDFSTAPTSSTTNATTTARIEFPITVNAGCSMTVTSVGYTYATQGGGGPTVAAFLVQGGTSTWLGYKNSAGSASYTSLSINLSAGSAKLVLVLGVASNPGNNRGFKFSAISINGTSTNSAPSHTVTAATNNASYGTAAAASGTVMEGSTTTITATPNSGYAFDHWTVSGTGATLSSTSTNPTTLTMGTADATVTAYFAESCDVQVFSLTDEIGSAVVTASDATVTAGTSLVMSNTSGRIKLTPASGKFKNGDKVEFGGTIGNTSKNYGIKIYASDGTTSAGNIYVAGTTSPLKASGTLSLASDQDYIFIARYDGTTTTLTSCEITRVSPCPEPPSCTAPNHVDISGRWDRFGGETISLTATAYSSAGTSSPIADGDITGWQWEKLIGSTWTALSNGTVDGVTTSGATTKNLQIANCGAGNSGKYRCVVSTGATCSTPSATKTDGSEGHGVKVYVLECYNGGTTEHHFTRTGDSQAGTLTMTLTANTAYIFKVHADNTYYGNNGTINKDEANWVMCNSDNGGDCANNLTVNSGLGGTFTFGIEYSTSGSSSVEGEPEISVTYPRKTIYLVPNSDWSSNSAKFAFHYYGATGTGWTDFLTSNDCGMSAEIPQWNGLKVIAVRFNPSDATPGWNGDGHVWNQTADITATADKNCVTITDWNAGTYGTYSIPTYTISYNAGTGGSGSKASESKTCGVAFTLPNSAVFTREGYTQTGWTTSDGGVQTHALGGTYTTNAAQAFYPVWTANNYDLTWNLGGGTTTSAGTGIGSGVSSNTTTSQAFGTALTAPTVTKTGYNFSAWSPAVASTMPAANTTYTATWTVKTTTITIDANTANHGSTAPGTVTATYGSTLPSFTAASGASGYSLTGYFTAATGGTKIINADGTLVASTSYADGSGNWNSEAATLTLYAQYEEEVSCPSSGTLYSAAVKSSVSSNQSFAANATTEVNTSTQADITGGKLYAINGESSAKNLIANSSGYKFCMTNNSTRFKIEMDCALQEGDIITIDGVGGTKNDAPMGLWVSSSESRPGSAPACVGTSTTTSLVDDLVNYTVTSSDEYHGKTILYIHRAVGSSTYFNNINISRPLACSTPASPSGLTNGATTANTQVVTWTANGEDTWEVYYSTSSSTPGTDQTPTATVTSATYTFTGLTASTTYYWWVRSVCDASHKSTWVAGSSFTTTSTPAELTAIEANVLYQAADMANITFTGSDQHFTGLSTNAKFKVYGTLGSSDAFGKNENHSVTDDIDTKNFTSALYITAADNTSTTSDPTKGAIEFITPSTAGTLYLYLNTSSSGLSIKKKGTSTSTSLSGGAYKKITVEANTHYFINGASSNRGLYGIKFIADVTAPTFVSSVPANGATGVATSGTIVLTFSEALGSVDASKFTLTGATKGAVSIDGSDATKVNIAYSGAANEATVTLATAAAAVSDLAGNTLAAALSNISFTTAAAEPEALIHWIVTVDASTWSLNGSPTTTDGTNITSISSSIDAASSPSTGASGTTAKVSLASASDNVDKAASFTFTVNSAKKVEPERVTCQVFNVGGSSGGQLSYKAQLSDNNGHIYYSTNTVVPASEATLTDATFTFASDLVLTGNVTIKVYGWKSGSAGSAFRMGADVKLFGEVQNAADYTVTHTLSNVTKSAGATSVKEGNNYTATYAGAGGYALPSTITVTIGGSPATAGTDYTWTQGTGVVSIPGNKVTGNIVITVTGVAVVNYSITYHCNGAESGCPSNVAAATNLPNPLPSAPTKDGYDFGGWYTDAECTAAAVAGAALTANTTLYAKWTVHSASECITIAYFETTSHNNSSSKPDNAGKYIYGYTNSAKTEAYAYTITSSTGDNKGQGTGESDYLRMNYGTTVTIYADNTTTGGTPASFSNVTSVSVDFKMMKSSYYTSFDIYVGSTKIANNVSLEGAAQSAFTTFTYDNLEQLSGTVRIVNKGSGSSNFHFYVDNIVICTASMSSCTTPTLPTATLSNQTVCEGSDIAAWDATPTNASTISGKSESISYSWKKKGNDTELATTATFDLGSSAAESQAGTYVVTVTVSKAGYASASANKEVDLAVTEGEEVTSIVADKATVYPGNSVTLTATANITPDSWQWYTCTSAEGAGAAIISGAESASYTIVSAGVAGTYYYKAVATGDCGTAEAVYTLVVSPAAGGDCFHFVSVIPASDFNASSGASLVTPTHATTLEGGTMKVGSQQVTFTKDYGLKMEGTKTVSITLESALEAGNVVIVKGTSGTKGYGITINGVNFYDADNKTFDVSYTVLADDGLVGKTALTVSKYSGNSYLQEVKITGCGESCTDPEVTASADNTTACVGTSVTFTATGAHAEATYQWQKLDGTWTNISGATASTYNIASVVAGDAGKYRVIASHNCNRTSNEVTLSVPSVPDFGSTVPSSVSVMQTIALSINTVEATDAVKYRWYKSADPTWDAGDVEIGTNKELIKAYDGEAIGSPSYYIFCRAQNACGITTSSAIAVNVTTYVEEDCATRGNEGDAAFSFENSGCGQGSYESTACWTMNSNSKILVYYPPTGKYFKTAKVTIASSSENKASYNWSTNGGTSFTAVRLNISTTLTERTIDLSAHGNVDAFQIGRNFDGQGSSNGTLYVSKICFEYTDACTATTVTPSTESTSYEMGGEWTDPTFTLAPAAVSGETLTYSSSNEDIASVDDDGTVTFNGEAGTVTITASYAGGTVAAVDYCASEGYYTITVSCPGGAPKVVVDGSVNMSGCNSSVTLHAKQQNGDAFADGTYQWFRNGTEIDGATSSSYTATQAGTYTVERTKDGCTSPSSNSAVVTSVTTEPEVERLVPFQYYHVDKAYSDQMKMRHLFAVKNSGKLDGKSFKMYVSRNGGAATDVTSSNALVVVPNADGHVDTVMVDLNKLSGKYSEDDELVFTCKAIDCESNVSEVYKNTITMNVIDETPTLALICSGSSKAGGTRKTGELTVGGDFLTGYNVADLCQQTGNTSFDANTEWGLYTDLKTQYIVTPVNGYAVFNKLNYEPFDILLLTDYPKASKSDAAKDVLDDMAALCDYRPMLSFKTHMVAKSPSKWAEKGFTTSPVVTKADGRLNLNIVCYAHPMFASLKTGDDVYTDVGNTSAPLVYTMLSGTGYESSKGMQGFELAAAENFVTIGLTHYNGEIAKNSPLAGEVTWTPGSEDRMLVTVAERQANPEARFILFSLNCGAQSKLTEKGEDVVLACLNYLLGTAEGTIEPADCSFTFDNGENNEHNDAWYASNCLECRGTKGDGKWNTAANWGPDYRLLPGEFTSVRIKKPVEVDSTHAHVMEVRLIEEGRIDIPAGKALDVKSTIRRMDGSEIYPTEENDIHIGSASTGNGTLIFNNDEGDTKARVDMYSKGFIDGEGVKNYQYMGTPFIEVNALYNYYGSWIYSWGEKKNGSIGWVAVKNGGPMSAWTGYCITQEGPTTHAMSGTLTATGSVDIPVPANENWVVGNSWTAPIDINALTTDDLEGLVANIYFFNTGVDKKGTAGEAGSRYAGGTYVTVPIHSAPYATEDDHINSMQGFFVKNTSGSAGALHLDYERHVRGTTRSSIIGDALHAPKRAQDADTDEPAVLKMKVCGENYDDKLLLLEREDFSTGFDNGWDGDKWDGNESALYLYTTDSEGTEYSVSAIPEMEGTVIGFRAGEDEAYTLKFEYLNGDETLYLFDIENNTYTEIKTGATYRFFTNDKEKHQRFVLTRKNPNVATEIDNVQSDKVQGSKVQKLLIEDKLFILRNGMLYDATGKVVK